MLIGIIALQGNIREHRDNLERHGVQSRYVKTPDGLDGIDGLVLPGGESTAMRRLIVSSGLEKPIQDVIQQGMPVWGTCAGVVLLACGGLWPCVDIEVERNAYGSQLNSRVVNGKSTISDKSEDMVFIRSPKISSAAADVEVLSSLNGDIVALRQRNILLTTFHPELVQDSPFTAYFINMVMMSQLIEGQRIMDHARN